MNRYTKRHDSILVLPERSGLFRKHIIYVDVDMLDFRPVRDLFQILCAAIAIFDMNTVDSWELMICHEINSLSSKMYKVKIYD